MPPHIQETPEEAKQKIVYYAQQVYATLLSDMNIPEAAKVLQKEYDAMHPDGKIQFEDRLHKIRLTALAVIKDPEDVAWQRTLFDLARPVAEVFYGLLKKKDAVSEPVREAYDGFIDKPSVSAYVALTKAGFSQTNLLLSEEDRDMSNLDPVNMKRMLSAVGEVISRKQVFVGLQ